jgi:hypothetical protein
LFLTKRRALLRANFKEIDMATSSLETVVSLWDIKNRNGERFDVYSNDDNWYLREVSKGADYIAGPVTGINFDYLTD